MFVFAVCPRLRPLLFEHLEARWFVYFILVCQYFTICCFLVPVGGAAGFAVAQHARNAGLAFNVSGGGETEHAFDSNSALLPEPPPWAGGVPHGAGEGIPSSEEDKHRQVRVLYEMLGFSPPVELQTEWEGRDKNKSKKVMSQLATAAKYGEPSSQFYPNEDQLRKVAGAAKIGYFVPSLLSEPEPKCDRFLSCYIRSLLPVAHAAMWQFRQSPAAILNEIGHLADLALNPGLSRLEAERQAVRWSLALRERL